jgi:hypothetical protein
MTRPDFTQPPSIDGLPVSQFVRETRVFISNVKKLESADVSDKARETATVEAVRRQVLAEDSYNVLSESNKNRREKASLMAVADSLFFVVMSSPARSPETLKAKAILLKRWHSDRSGALHPSSDMGERLAFLLAEDILAL